MIDQSPLDVVGYRDNTPGGTTLDCTHPCLWGPTYASWTAQLARVVLEREARRRERCGEGAGGCAQTKRERAGGRGTRGFMAIVLALEMQESSRFGGSPASAGRSAGEYEE